MSFLLSLQFVKQTCCNCGIAFALENEHYERLRDSHDWFFCPAGHQQHFTGKSDKQKAEDKRDFWEREANRKQVECRRLEHQRRGEKAAKTRLKNRIAAGVCPCCNRSFENLHRHMTNQHPDFQEQP